MSAINLDAKRRCRLFLLVVVVCAIPSCGAPVAAPTARPIATPQSTSIEPPSEPLPPSNGEPNPVTAAESRAQLIQQVEYWTSTQYQYGASGTETGAVRLTYLSPQLIEAAINHQVALGHMSNRDVRELRNEVTRRLVEKNYIPFILRIENGQKSRLCVRFWTVSLITNDGGKIAPTEYDRSLEEGVRFGEQRQGYVMFPRVQEQITTVDLATSVSFAVRLAVHTELASVSCQRNAPLLFPSEGEQTMAFSFNLVPLDFPVRELSRFEIPPQKSLDIADALSIIDSVLSIVSLFF